MKKKHNNKDQHKGCPYRKHCDKIEALCPYLYQRPIKTRSYVK